MVVQIPEMGSGVPTSIVRDFPQCSPYKIKIIHIGCGASGILFSHKVRKYLKNYEFVIYEKNPIAGGTWYENRYPGCACDVPAHTYTFPSEPNPEWSGYYTGAAEIQEYMLKTSKKWNVDEFTRYNTEVLSAIWNEVDGVWDVRLKSGEGHEFTDKCNVLVNGTGVVNRWKWPDIEGLHDFNGTLVHTAAWDTSVDWADKRVAVIGSGSSSIQLVPQLGKTAKQLDVYIRNPTYVGPLTSMAIDNTEADPEATDPSSTTFHQYTEKEKQKFRDDPEYHLNYRKSIEQRANSGFPIFIRGSQYNVGFKAAWQTQMAEKLKVDEQLMKFLIPEWSPGCRRLSPGNGYLETLVQDNVKVCTSDIVKVTRTGVLTSDGIERPVEIIACATGFNVQYLPHFKITGSHGQIMQGQEPNVYASIATPGFPNYFVVNGPRGNWGQGCALPSHEVQVEYILKCCKKMQEDRIKAMSPRLDVTNQLNEYMDAWHRERSIWAEDCRSWYKDNKPDGRVHIWSGSLMHLLKYLKHPRYEHYNIEYLDSNMFSLLGNGFTITEENAANGGTELPVAYIRNNEDEAWDIE